MTFRLRSPAVVALTTLLAACGGTGFIGVPFVTSVNGASWPAGAVGSQVVISGQVFGSVQGSSQVLFTNAVGGIALPATITSASNWTDTYIITTVPAGAFKGPVVVSTGGGIGGGTIFTVTPSVPEVPFTPSAAPTTRAPRSRACTTPRSRRPARSARGPRRPRCPRGWPFTRPSWP